MIYFICFSAEEGLLNQLGICMFCKPRPCLGGPTKSTWNPYNFASQAWEGLLNQLGIHCGPRFAYSEHGEGKGGTKLADGHPIQRYVGDLG